MAKKDVAVKDVSALLKPEMKVKEADPRKLFEFTDKLGEGYADLSLSCCSRMSFFTCPAVASLRVYVCVSTCC